MHQDGNSPTDGAGLPSGEDPRVHDPSAVPDLPSRLGIPGRIAVLLLSVLLVYLAVRAVTHGLFAPTLEAGELVVPATAVRSGDPVVVGAVVRNTGRVPGSAFAVAVHEGGSSVEGRPRTVPAGDTAFVGVEIVAGSGHAPTRVSIFDGWGSRGRVRTYRSVFWETTPRSAPLRSVDPAGPVPRGDRLEAAAAWSNPGPRDERVVPLAVLRPLDGGPPVAARGNEVVVPAGGSTTLRVGIDTWRLAPGPWSLRMHVETPEGRTAGRSPGTLTVEVAVR